MEDFSQYNGEGTTLRKVQLRLLDMLVEIDRICRKNNINYWIDCGTLLGAVRHGGFIPWDDDLDIAMLEEDYHRFLEIAPKELPKNLFLQTKTSDPSFRRTLVKIRDNNSFFITPHDDFTKDYHKGMFIDIFKLEPYPNINPKLRKSILHWYWKTSGFFIVKQEVNLKNHLAAITFPIIKLGLDIVWRMFSIGNKKDLGYEKHFAPSGAAYTKDMILPLKEIQFEGHTFPCPFDPDRYLTRLFGDYMKIPPKEKREKHLIYVDLH
jgi:lipopolysaccharide cholinephosphotransferase